MKQLVIILVAGVVAFMAVAIVQERELFLNALAGRPTRPSTKVSDEHLKSAAAALQRFHSVSRHLYASGGDPRFAERLLAEPPVVDELLQDIAYLRRFGRTQSAELMGLEVLESSPAGPGNRIELKTREYWIIHLLRLADRQPEEPPRSQVQYVTYRLKLDGTTWRLHGWELGDPPADEAAGAPPAPSGGG